MGVRCCFCVLVVGVMKKKKRIRSVLFEMVGGSEGRMSRREEEEKDWKKQEDLK